MAFVVILEDNADHKAAMRTHIGAVLPECEVIFFDDEQQMISWLANHLGEVVLISLDHDLPLRQLDGKRVDSGTGRQVSDFLATIPPTCPVIIHSSNHDAAQGMFFGLREGGWPCSQVYPCDDTAWIADAWAGQIRRYIRDGWIANELAE